MSSSWRHSSRHTLLDGGAQSVRYGEIIHDGSGQFDSVNYQEVADSEIFVMGKDAAEFANKVKDQVRKKTEKECRTLQILEKSIRYFGECSWLRR